MSFQINKVAVIGAGTMGGGIAAHLANVGIPVVLLDIVPPDLTEEERGNPAARNRIVQTLFDRMAKSRPASLARKDRADLITLGNLDDDFDLIADCDWVIEAIIEKLEPKQALMARIEAVGKEGCIVTSNTSGIPIHKICEGRTDAFRAHFLGTHFFNPPRYLKLLEIIPTPETRKDVLSYMVAFGRDVLGKGVVVCKDTPNFISNRFIAISGSYGAEYALKNGYSVEEVDAITGPLIGRPKTASYRLTDLVGLDIMVHMNSNLYPLIPDDAYRETLKGELSVSNQQMMMEKGWLGNKTGQGYYKKTMVDGKREFWVLDMQTMEYQPPTKVRFESVGAVRKIDDLGERLRALLALDDRAATYVRDTLYFNLAYAAYITPEIAYSLADVDNANRWGFALEAGPFEVWDMLGVAETAEAMESAGLEIAGWVKEMLADGHASFYRNGDYYDFESKEYKPAEVDKNVMLVSEFKSAGMEVASNASASLIDMGDGIALLEFHAKMNAIDQDIVEMSYAALDRLGSDFDGLVIGNNGQDFCVGANIAVAGIAAAQGLWDQIDQGLFAVQDVMYKLRHAPKPVVTAPHQRVLGGGVEFSMAGWEVVADHETYMGFVEVGVGLIPAGGGCKEMLRRKLNPVMVNPDGDPLPVMQEVFQQLATAQVGASAWENRSLGYLADSDTIAMNSDHRLAIAKRRALQLVSSGAQPPETEKVYAGGRDLLSAMKLMLQSFVWGGYASEHDQLIGNKMAYVLCGGDLSGPAWVDPWYILDLEREAFVSLLGEQKTRDRIMHMLQTGKPLRN